jgi:hypothetical protein
MKKKSALLALILLPAFFLLHNYNELFGFIPVKDLFFYALVMYPLLGLAYFIMLRLKIPTSKASLILFSITFFMLFFTPIHDAYKTITFNSIFSHYWILLPLACLLLLLLARKIINTENISPKVFNLINLIIICLIITELFTSFRKNSDLKKNKNLVYPDKPLSEKFVSTNMSDSSKPDIYFFVFDEYTNNKALKKMWNYDNSDITDWLTSKNFHIPSDTHCNYSFTVFSVSSTFNMNYINRNVGGDGTINSNVMKANQSLSDNETFSILKKENYDIHFLAPFKNSIQENGLGHFFDYLVDGQIPGQTLPGSLGGTIIADLRSTKSYYRKDSLDFAAQLEQKCKQIKSTIDQVEATTDSSVNRKPHFVYGHILVPHVPHIYDSSGQLLTRKESIDIPLYNTYTAQVKYANVLIKQLVSYIQEHNKKNTIIIIEGDHGFRRFPDSLSQYALPNFNAIYFPDKNYSMLYDTLSPVNTFRIVFDKYFNQHFPLLKDSSVIVKDYIY